MSYEWQNIFLTHLAIEPHHIGFFFWGGAGGKGQFHRGYLYMLQPMCLFIYFKFLSPFVVLCPFKHPIKNTLEFFPTT